MEPVGSLLETKPEKTGYYNGKFTLTFPAIDTESTDSEDTTKPEKQRSPLH